MLDQLDEKENGLGKQDKMQKEGKQADTFWTMRALFISSAIIFLVANVVVTLANYSPIAKGFVFVAILEEAIAIFLSLVGLMMLIVIALYSKPRLIKSFRKQTPESRLEVKILYGLLTMVNAVFNIVGQSQLQNVWIIISLVFVFILFAVDEYVKDQPAPTDQPRQSATQPP